ncbi:MAG TPA: hypothetical protein VK728_00820 [Candidatus Sulfotelmatobacter sp.]|jgi:hypothetical protein|nr:hypothetical protein [Candidatus Sulfotelmatobacter sp.]
MTTENPAQTQQQSPSSVLMVMNGQTAYVPISQAENAIGQGGELGVRMTDSQGNRAIVPFSQQDRAQQNGATWDVTPENDATKAYMTWRQQALANRPTDLLGRPANVPLTPPANLGTGPTIGGSSDQSAKLSSIPLAKKLFDAAEALDDAAGFTEEGKAQHPIQAELGQVADRLKGFLFGGAVTPGIGTGKYGMLTNPVTASLIPGAEGTPAAADAIEGGANILKGGVDALKSGAAAIKEAVSGGGEVADAANAAAQVPAATPTKISTFQQALSGEKVAQGPATSAVTESANTAADAANVATPQGGINSFGDVGNSVLKGAKSTYQQVDQAAGTNLKQLYEKLDLAQDKARQALEGSPEEDAALLNAQKVQWKINDAITSAKENSNADVEGLLNNADEQWKQGSALKDLDTQVFRSRASGATDTGMAQSVDPKKLLPRLQQMYKAGRLSEAIGDDNAINLLKQTNDAVKLGTKAARIQKVALGAAGAGATALGGAAAHFGWQLIPQ